MLCIDLQSEEWFFFEAEFFAFADPFSEPVDSLTLIILFLAQLFKLLTLAYKNKLLRLLFKVTYFVLNNDRLI